jgi:tetratricopeptide (TPR) repeat protein
LVVALAVLLGFVGTTVGLARANRAQVEAERNATSAQQTASFLVGMFQAFDPVKSRGSTPTAREIVDLGAKRLETERTIDPRIQGRLLDTIGTVYRQLGAHDEAVRLLDRALEIQTREFGTDSLQYAEAVGHRAQALAVRAAWNGPVMEEAAAGVRLMLDTRRRFLGNHYKDLPEDLALVALYTRNAGRPEEALPFARQAVALAPADHPLLPTLLHVLLNTELVLATKAGSTNGFQGEVELRERIVRLQKERHGSGDNMLAFHLFSLGLAYEREGRHEEADAQFRESLEVRKKIFGPEHPEALWQVRFNAYHFAARGKPGEAISLLREALDILRKRDPRDNEYLVLLAGYRALAGDRAGALRELRRAIQSGYRSVDNDYDLEDDLAKSAYFESLRQDPEFQELARKARPLQAP